MTRFALIITGTIDGDPEAVAEALEAMEVGAFVQCSEPVGHDGESIAASVDGAAAAMLTSPEDGSYIVGILRDPAGAEVADVILGGDEASAYPLSTEEQVALAERYRAMVREVGAGFHPDTRDYVELPAPWTQERVDALVEEVLSAQLDPYALALQVDHGLRRA